MELLSLAVSSAAGGAAIIFGVTAYLRGRRADSQSLGYRDGTLLTELGYIRSGVDDIRHRQERQEQQYISVVSRLTALEARLNNLEHMEHAE